MNIHERIKKEGIDVEKSLDEQPYWYVLYLENLARENVSCVQYFNEPLKGWVKLKPSFNLFPEPTLAFRPTPITEI